MKTAICPGSFDPVTIGHIDIIHRAAKLFDKVIVVVMINYHKPAGYFTVEERVELLKRSLTDIDNVEIETYGGLLVEYAEQVGACAIVKGLRAVSDFDWEFQMALANKKIKPEIETLFLASSEKHTYLSSTVVKELGKYGAELDDFVPPEIIEDVKKKFESGGV